ncbi:MAG: cell division protein FtsW [Salinibacterium sp.]|nr:cell division protein FtsW [Salinibacterium sp.]
MIRPGHIIALAVLALLTLGTMMVASAGMRVAPLGVDGYTTEGITLKSILLSRNTAYTAAALVLLGVASRLPVRSLARASLGPGASRVSERGSLMLWGLMVGAMFAVVAVVYFPGIGHTVNGSSRWVRFGSFTFQPSEIAKWSLVAAVAWYAVARRDQMHSFVRGLLPVAIGSGLLVGLVAIEDLGTGVLMGAVVGVMLLASGARLWHLLMFVPPALAAVLALIVTSAYRARRILAFLDPFAYPETHGYHMIQSMIAIANGHGVGRGLRNGLQKFGYLPEDRTDFLFAVICEELGLLGAIIVAGLYAAILLAATRIIRREREPMLQLFGVGVTATIGLQALINMIVVTGLGPTKGIALPLLSAGGTGWMLTAACLGVLIAMDRAHMSEPEAAALDDEADDTLWEPSIA